LRTRVERVPETVAEDVQRQYGQDDRDPGYERQPGRGHDPILTLRDQDPPGGVRRLDASAEERQPGLREDVGRDDQREEDERRRGDVREQLEEHDANRPGPEPASRLDELLLAQRE